MHSPRLVCLAHTLQVDRNALKEDLGASRRLAELHREAAGVEGRLRSTTQERTSLAHERHRRMVSGRHESACDGAQGGRASTDVAHAQQL